MTNSLALPLRLALLPLLYELQRSGRLSFCEVSLEQLIEPHTLVLDAIDTLMNCGVEVRLHSVGILPGGDWMPQLRALHALREWCEPSLLSVHIAGSRGQGQYGESFQRPAYGPEFERRVLGHLAQLKQATDLPIAIENIAAYENASERPSEEIQFLSRVALQSGALVVFDFSNHLTTYCQADSGGYDQIARLPIAHLHVSGGRWLNGKYFDTHCDPIPDEHLQFLRSLRCYGNFPVLYERDGRLDASAEISAEIATLLEVQAHAEVL